MQQRKETDMKKISMHGGHGLAAHNDMSKTRMQRKDAPGNRYWSYSDFAGVPTPFECVDFTKSELEFYKTHYGKYLHEANARAKDNRHPERVKSLKEFYQSDRYKPHEMIIQIGNQDNGSVPCNALWNVCERLRDQIESKHVHVLNMALHAHETTPHVHLRYVVDDINKHNELMPLLESGLSNSGFKRPDTSKKTSRYNCALSTFTRFCRDTVANICRNELNIAIDDHIQQQHRKYRTCAAQDRIDAYAEMDAVVDRLDALKGELSTLKGELDVLQRDHTVLAIAAHLAEHPDELEQMQLRSYTCDELEHDYDYEFD